MDRQTAFFTRTDCFWQCVKNQTRIHLNLPETKLTKPPPRSERHCHYTYITEFRPSQQEVTIVGIISYCVLPKILKVCIMHEYFKISLHQIKLTSPYWTAPGVRGIFWEAVLNHVQAAGVQRDGEKMLQASREGLQRRRSRDLSDRLWGVMQHQVRMEIR